MARTVAIGTKEKDTGREVTLYVHGFLFRETALEQEWRECHQRLVAKKRWGKTALLWRWEAGEPRFPIVAPMLWVARAYRLRRVLVHELIGLWPA